MSRRPASEWMTLRIPAREPMILRGSTDDGGVVGSIRDTEHYEGHVMLALHALLAGDAVCIDGGANIGALSLAMAAYAPRGHVYAFEPGAENLAYLRANLDANGVTNVTPVAAGLWHTSGQLRLHSDPTHPAGAFIAEHGDGFTSEESVPVVSLDDWCNEQRLDRLDLLKLDIEGAEPCALAGAAATIEKFDPVLLIEFNPLSLVRFQHTQPDAFYRQIRGQFRYVTHVTGTGRLRRILSASHLRRLVQTKGLVDLVASNRLPPTIAGPRGRFAAPAREFARLVLQHNRFRAPSQAFMCSPKFSATCAVPVIELHANEKTTVPVTVTNTSDTWWSSDYPHHPIVASYHWADASGDIVVRNGLRTLFDHPVAPGRTVDIELDVQAPSDPGDYELRFSIVQERFAWSDEVDPLLAHRIPAHIRSA